MLRVISCIAFEHDTVLVTIAALICTIGAVITVRLLQRTAESAGIARISWGFIGAIAAGSTIWCTHFIGMLAYKPGLAVTYDLGLTLLSLTIAMTGCAAALAIASEKIRFAPHIGGIAFGISTSAMHYSGMAAFAVNGTISWDATYIAASVLLGCVFGVLAFTATVSPADRQQAGAAATGSSHKFVNLRHQVHLIFSGRSHHAMIIGAGFLLLAIVSMHFTGMASLEVTPLAPVLGTSIDEPGRMLLVFAVVTVCILVLGTGAVSYFLDSQAQTHARYRMRYLTDSSVDGMAIISAGKIVEANPEFERMTGRTRADLIGREMDDLLICDNDLKCGTLMRADLKVTDDTTIPVELATRTEAATDASEPITVHAIRDISQRIAQEERIKFLAKFDSLTGLRNRPSFLERASDLIGWRGEDSKFAVFAIDLDRFKDVNDVHGHAAGDEVLRSMGQRITKMLGQNFMGARLGGDEFVILGEIKNRNDGVTLADRLEETLSQGIAFDGVTLNCQPSIGVSFFPADGTEINELLNNADLAMYRAKSSETSHICLYDKGMDDSVRERRKLIEELREAISNDQLMLHYQVQVSVPDENIVGYEALVRWNHPSRGLVPPNDFIPLAEQSGLISKLGEWVLRCACREAAGWDNTLPVSVNLSQSQLTDVGFVELVQDILVESGLPPHRLELEVTETCFVSDQTRAVAALQKLKDAGIAVSIDDFGTGYSSLAMLQSFPFDKIKLDKSLIDDIALSPKSKGVFKAVLSLGDALSVPILAEGVETREQLDYLSAQGCRLVQGYYYGKPERVTGAKLVHKTSYARAVGE